MALARNQIWLGLRPSFPHSGDLLKLHVIRFMVNAFCTDFELKRKKCLWIPRAHFPISIAIKGIGISCSTGFQQPFWKLIGFDPVSSGGEEMTGGGSLVEVAWPGLMITTRLRVTSVQTQVLVTSLELETDHFSRLTSRGRKLYWTIIPLPPHPWAIINLSGHHLALKQLAEKQAKSDQWFSCGMSTLK